MKMTIEIPDSLLNRLKFQAAALQLSFENYMLTLLSQFTDNEDIPVSLPLEKIVAKIPAQRPNTPISFANSEAKRLALAQSLQLLIERDKDAPKLDEIAWNHQWAKIEADMKNASLINEETKGIG